MFHTRLYLLILLAIPMLAQAQVPTPAPELTGVATWEILDAGLPQEADEYIVYQIEGDNTFEVGRGTTSPITVDVAGGYYGYRYFFLESKNAAGFVYGAVFMGSYFAEGTAEMPDVIIETNPILPNSVQVIVIKLVVKTDP